MNINKSQGQPLRHVGEYLPHSIFSHGQLYVSKGYFKEILEDMMIGDECKDTYTTSNVVYK